MEMRYSRISGWGKYAPENVLTNFDLEKIVDTNDEWITKMTGIKERRIISEGETASSMAVEATNKALEVAGLTPADLDLIIVASSSPDYLVPAVSSTVQYKLGADCPAMTVVSGCTGFVYGMVTAHQFIATGAYDNILVVGVEVISKFINWEDRNTCVLFGDGAGAIIMSPSNTSTGVMSFDMGSDGAKGHHLMAPGIGSAGTMDYGMLDRKEQYLQMNGREVFKFATRVLPKSTLQTLENAGMTLDDVDLLIPHQANARIIDLAVRRLGIDKEKVFVNLHKYGNTAAASIPLALIEAVEEGRVKEGDKLCMVSFGSGLTWASAVVQWGQPLDNSEEIAQEDLIWDLNSIRTKMALTSTKMRVKARTVFEEASYKASAMMLPLYTFTGRKPPKKLKKKEDKKK